MRALDARLAFAVSTSMGKVNQQIGTPTPSVWPSFFHLPSSSVVFSPCTLLEDWIMGGVKRIKHLL